MFKAKLDRLFRRLKRNARPMVTVWLPAGAVTLFAGGLLLSVALSTDAAYHPCFEQMTQCVGDRTSLLRIGTCSYRLAWCDATVTWDKLNGKQFPDLPGLPVPDEKAERELFEKLTSDEVLERRSLEQNSLDAEKTGVDDAESPSEYMERARRERITFEHQQALKRKAFAAELENAGKSSDDLTGKSVQ